MTVLALKNTIAQQHPLQPPPDAQRLIFGGRMLADDQILRDLINTEHVRRNNADLAASDVRRSISPYRFGSILSCAS